MRVDMDMLELHYLKTKFAHNNNPIINSSQIDNETTLLIQEKVEEIDDIVELTVDEHWKEAIICGASYELGKKLEKKLCSFAGEALCYDYDEYAQIILDEGQLWSGNYIYPVKMSLGNCHDNIIDVYKKDSSNPIVVGFALNNYGFWFSHTWSLKKDNDGIFVIETTIPSILYYGVVLLKKK